MRQRYNNLIYNLCFIPCFLTFYLTLFALYSTFEMCFINKVYLYYYEYYEYLREVKLCLMIGEASILVC